MSPILIVPACEKGRGGGHLSRSLLLLKSLQAEGRDAFLWIPAHLKDDFLQRFREFFEGHTRQSFLSSREELGGRAWDFIVLDHFRTTSAEFAFWSNLAPLIGIDEGGPCRKRFDFLIDLLPGLSRHKPNLFSPGLLPMPKRRRASGFSGGPLRVLISFGAEDEQRLGVFTARALSRAFGGTDQSANRGTDPQITLIDPLCDSTGQEEIRGVKVMGKIPMLRESFAEYDLFITHFGLGAFEAVYARLPVLLVSPTAYHEKLARKAGFYCIKPGQVRRLGSMMNVDFLQKLNQRTDALRRQFALEYDKHTQDKHTKIDKKEDFSSFICGLELQAPVNCPVCGEKNRGPVLVRFSEQTFRRCPGCGVIFQSRFTAPPIEYEKEYFFDSYKKQYGKTYLEDFPNLKEMGRKRLEHIKNLSANNFLVKKREETQSENVKPALLDIGCAYGPFLAAAAEEGFECFGVEPAADAARYVKEELGLKVWHGFFPSALPPEFLEREGNSAGGKSTGSATGTAAVCLWYVIEHFREPGEVLQVINGLLKTGGVLAISTPSFSGVSGRKSLHSFLEKSPADHFTVWSPRSCRKILAHYGFHLKKIVVTGHHPERFPLFGRFLRQKTPLFGILLFFSRFFRLGDTFEAYAVKE